MGLCYQKKLPSCPAPCDSAPPPPESSCSRSLFQRFLVSELKCRFPNTFRTARARVSRNLNFGKNSRDATLTSTKAEKAQRLLSTKAERWFGLRMSGSKLLAITVHTFHNNYIPLNLIYISLTRTVPDVDMHCVPCRHLCTSQPVYIHIGISGNNGIQSWGLLVVPARIVHSGIIVIRKSLVVSEVSDFEVLFCICNINSTQQSECNAY